MGKSKSVGYIDEFRSIESEESVIPNFYDVEPEIQTIGVKNIIVPTLLHGKGIPEKFEISNEKKEEEAAHLTRRDKGALGMEISGIGLIVIGIVFWNYFAAFGFLSMLIGGLVKEPSKEEPTQPGVAIPTVGSP